MVRDLITGRWLRIGVAVYGIGAIALGLTGIAWRDFALSWQPVPADVPYRPMLAFAVAGIFVVAGVAAQSRRFARGGLAVLVLLYALDCLLLQAPRVVASPTVLATWLGLAEQGALVIGGVVARTSTMPSDGPIPTRMLWWGQRLFGVCLVLFAFAHFAYPAETAGLVPGWLPPDGRFWAYATGAAHLLAGIALNLDRLAIVASALVTVMFAGFGMLVWAPMLLSPPTHLGAAGNAVNLALTGAACVLAGALATARQRGRSETDGRP